jgi:hypothetical protein
MKDCGANKEQNNQNNQELLNRRYFCEDFFSAYWESDL